MQRNACHSANKFPILEQFRNTDRLFEGREGRLFPDKEPLERVLSVCTNSDNAIVARLYLRSAAATWGRGRA